MNESHIPKTINAAGNSITEIRFSRFLLKSAKFNQSSAEAKMEIGKKTNRYRLVDDCRWKKLTNKIPPSEARSSIKFCFVLFLSFHSDNEKINRVTRLIPITKMSLNRNLRKNELYLA